jgi:hypothetical protein
MPPKDLRFLLQEGQCFVCHPSPLPLRIQSARNEVFAAGMAYALVILSYCPEGAGICEEHKPMVHEVLDTIEQAIDELEDEEVLADAFENPEKKIPTRAN